MSKRISSFFSSKDGDVPRSSSSPHLSALNTSGTSPRGKLTKSMPKSPSDLNLNAHLDADLALPPILTESGISSRPSSRDGRGPVRVDTGGSRHSSSSRPQTPNTLGVPNTASPVREMSPSTGKISKRRSWLPTKVDRDSTGSEQAAPSCQAWIAGLRETVPYDVTGLLNGDPVEDLWDKTGDVLVYLYPEASQKGPSFRVNSQLFADSRVLSYLTHPMRVNGHGPTPSISLEPASPMAALSLEDQIDQTFYQNGQIQSTSTSSYNMPEQQTKSVHLPLNLEGDYSVAGTLPKGDDLELIVLYRNFFAFLCGGALVATNRQNSLYAIFMSISSILRRLRYGNEKESSWGTVPWASFSRYTDELRLADVRSSREKNIEAILIGVAMKSWPLYAEGFSHAAGRLEDLKSIKSPKFDRIDPGILNKLERANHDLQTFRMQPLHSKLDNFYFPSMFAGLANSQTATEAKLVGFKTWKLCFSDFRTHVSNVYKKRYGSWPPKASSKKNSFEESGLNRLLIREVYQDFTDLYDLVVDRTSLSPRTTKMSALADNAASGSNETIQHALRMVESEYDRSNLPVVPPIPFDVPLIPAFAKVMLAKDAQNAKKLKDDEVDAVLYGAYNRDAIKKTPWMQDFMDLERKMCQTRTIQEIADVRCGLWLFIYAVLQALPMTVVDARDLKYTDGVEYFLCEAPKGGRPWVDDDVSTSRAWYNVASGGGLVSMPADSIDHSVEGIYRRSHCWTAATKWAEALGPTSPVREHSQPHQFSAANVIPSPYLAPTGGSATVSPYGSPLLQPISSPNYETGTGLPRVSSRTSMHMGLQEVEAPAQANQRASTYNPNITFDGIFASQQIQQKSGKKGKK